MSYFLRAHADARNLLPQGLTPARVAELQQRIREMVVSDENRTGRNSETLTAVTGKEAFEKSQEIYNQYSKRLEYSQRSHKRRLDLCLKVRL